MSVLPGGEPAGGCAEVVLVDVVGVRRRGKEGVKTFGKVYWCFYGHWEGVGLVDTGVQEG